MLVNYYIGAKSAYLPKEIKVLQSGDLEWGNVVILVKNVHFCSDLIGFESVRRPLKSCVFADVRVQVPSGVQSLSEMRGFFVSIPFIINFITMNHIVLIGNGFDLAHGLETSYIHFLNWYLKNIEQAIEEKQFYEDDIIIISYKQESVSTFSNNMISQLSQKTTLSNSPLAVLQILKEKNYIVSFKSRFIAELFDKIQTNTWVDIENSYYSWIIRIYKSLQSSTHNSRERDESRLKTELKILNKSFNEIKNQLEKYLTFLNTDNRIESKLDIENHFKRIVKSLSKNTVDKICIVNFNYTNTINTYVKDYNNIEMIQIHGSLNNKQNPIIFGYGDETDELYEKIENLNDNEYLKFMKSFEYFKTNSYQNLIEFINGNPYSVHVMGHSCGLSDRVLLKRIFENKYCKSINIYYYQISEHENDYTNKCMDISRHFSIDKKDIMRERITSEKDSLPLVSYKAK